MTDMYFIVDTYRYEDNIRSAHSKSEVEDIVKEMVEHEDVDPDNICIYSACEANYSIERTVTVTIHG